MTPATKANIKFPYQNWESLIRHSQEVEKVPLFRPKVPDLPRIILTPQEQAQVYKRIYRRNQLESKRTGVKYVPKNKGGAHIKSTIQEIKPFRTY
jgi:hypothetical protein